MNTSRVGDSTTSLGSPFQCLTTLSEKVVFPNIQPEPSLVQLEAIPSSPITSYTREEADPQLTATSLQAARESNKVSPDPLLLQTAQSQLLQLLLIRPVLLALCFNWNILRMESYKIFVRTPGRVNYMKLKASE